MTNLLHLIERDTRLKRVAGTQGGEWHGPCPFCGGKDRFIVQPNHERGRWACRQCSPNWDDAIAYIRRREGIGFVEARERVEGPTTGQTPALRDCVRRTGRRNVRPLSRNDRSPEPAPTAERQNPEWQAAALAFARQSFDRLRGPDGARARAYLEGRGLPGRACVAHALGYNDRDRRETWGGVDVYLPRGIVLPWRTYEQVWKVNIRRPVGEPRYMQAAGGGNGLYRMDEVMLNMTVVLVEGEFDALSIFESLRGRPDMAGRFAPVATGSTTGARAGEWMMRLAKAPAVLLAFDADDAGDTAAAWWQARLHNATRLRPARHDVNEMLVQGDDVAAWLGA